MPYKDPAAQKRAQREWYLRKKARRARKKTNGKPYLTPGYVPTLGWLKKQYDVRGLIWRTLAVYAGLTVSQLHVLTGIARHTLNYHLNDMESYRAVRVDRGRTPVWHACKVTDEWLSVLL